MMKKDEFIWAVRRLTGDRPAPKLLAELRRMLRITYGVGMFTDVPHVQYVVCLVDVVQVVRTFEIRRIERNRDRIIANLAGPGMVAG